MEEENKLALLDLIVIRNTNDTINTTAHRKLTRHPEVLSVKKVFLEIFAKFIGKHLCQSLFFNKLAGLTHTTLLKKTL